MRIIQIKLAVRARLIEISSFDYSLNCTPLSPFAIANIMINDEDNSDNDNKNKQ